MRGLCSYINITWEKFGLLCSLVVNNTSLWLSDTFSTAAFFLCYYYFWYEGLCVWFKRPLFTVYGSDASGVLCLCPCLWYSQKTFAGFEQAHCLVGWHVHVSTHLGERIFEVLSLHRARSALGSGESCFFLDRPRETVYIYRNHTGRGMSIIPITTILRAPKELSPIQQTACKVLTVRGYFRQGWYRFSLIISRDSYKVLCSADAEAFPRESNGRSINFTTHKYDAKIINVRISAVLALYKFMAWRPRRS
jgi:hypothetical protein